MKRFQNAFSLLLALLLILLPLTACRSDANDAVPTATTATAATKSEQDSPSVLLSDDGGARYAVILPQGCHASLTDAARAVAEYPAQKHQKSALNLPLKTDDGEQTGAELLLGYTNRPESLEVLQSIGYDDFAIVKKGNGIVVAAHREERLLQALVYLCDHLLKVVPNEIGGYSLLYEGDYTFVGQNVFLFDTQNKLCDYSIVYREGSDTLKAAAEKLRDEIAKTYGTNVAIKSDASPESAQEIVLGRTNRAASKKYFTAQTNVYGFASLVVTEKKALLIGSYTDDLTTQSVEKFIQDRFQKHYSYTFNVEADTSAVDTGFTFSESPALADGAEMRIMSFNILSEYYGPKVSVDERKNIVAATILTYSPDVIGLQEATARWKKALSLLLDGQYAFVDTKTERDKDNASPLFYNVEKVTLLEHGVKTLASGNSVNMRVISWGYFERKSDGERFFVANTHWDLTAMPESRTKQAIEMGDFVAEMKVKYGCPAITVGDYNTQSHQEQFQTYLDHSKLSDAGLSAKVINRNYKSTHDLFQEQVPAPDILAIDHVFYSADVEALYYNMLIDKDVLNASDHFPVYADLCFKSN